MNKIVKFQKHGGPEVLEIHSEPLTKPVGTEVLVRMTALALNRSNSLFREGTYLLTATFPSRIGTEGSGIIEAIGNQVSNWEVGQKINLLVPLNESDSGYAAKYNIVEQDRLISLPNGLSDRDAATAWVPFLTLYHFFIENNWVAKDKWIVLPAASSSVSLAANSLAQHFGAKTIGITRTSKKLDDLNAAGYNAIIVSEEGNIAEKIMNITTDGADYAFDSVAGPNLTELVKGMKMGGEITVFGALDSRETPLPIFDMMTRGVQIKVYTLYELLIDRTRLMAAIDFYTKLFDANSIAPSVDENEFSLDQISDAFDFMESNQQVGKVVITI
ncbi:MAG: zinc-binding dehydrogenase [Flavobacteriales bacterium]|nr:zinc-binding dehydrogenase [Flavobacteriales bacterium]